LLDIDWRAESDKVGQIDTGRREGEFGSVFAVPDKRYVLKVMKRPVTLEQAIKDVSNEAASFHLTTTISRIASGSMASRSKPVLFASLPATEVCGSTSGAV
jgi:hypothetical protein